MAAWIAFTTTVSILLAIIHQGEALTCHSCSSFNGTDCYELSGPALPCHHNEDVCIKVETVIEKPWNGGDIFAKREEVVKYITRGCGSKEAFMHFVKTDRCINENIGGGGFQVRCMCTGNDCNGSATIAASVGFILMAVCTKFL